MLACPWLSWFQITYTWQYVHVAIVWSHHSSPTFVFAGIQVDGITTFEQGHVAHTDWYRRVSFFCFCIYFGSWLPQLVWSFSSPSTILLLVWCTSWKTLARCLVSLVGAIDAPPFHTRFEPFDPWVVVLVRCHHALQVLLPSRVALMQDGQFFLSNY